MGEEKNVVVQNPLRPEDDFEFLYVWRAIPITGNGETMDRACARVQEAGFEYVDTTRGMMTDVDPSMPARDRGAVHLFRMKRSEWEAVVGWEAVKRAKSGAGSSEE